MLFNTSLVITAHYVARRLSHSISLAFSESQSRRRPTPAVGPPRGIPGTCPDTKRCGSETDGAPSRRPCAGAFGGRRPEGDERDQTEPRSLAPRVSTGSERAGPTAGSGRLGN